MAGKISDELNETIRLEFVEGYLGENDARIWPTLEALIERHNVPKNTVYRRAKAQGWVEQKQEFHAIYTAEVTRKRAELKAKQAANFDDIAFGSAQQMLGKVQRKIVASVRDERDENRVDTLTLKDLNDLMDIGLKAQKLGKVALGEADQITKVVADDDVPASLARLLEQLDEVAEAKSQGARHTLQ